MALGDSKRTSEYDYQQGLGTYNNNTDVFKYVIITESYSAIDANATAIGIANFTKVASSGNYVQDTTLANSTWTRAANVSKLGFDDFNFAADGANPTTGKTIAIYNDTSAGKDVYKFVDLTADGGTTPADTTLGLNYTVNAGGSGTVTTNV
jgi:hypothetical protein